MKLFLFFSLIFLSFQASAEQWLCVTERMIGFVVDEQTRVWEPTAFADNPKYVISTSSEAGSSHYTVKQHGSNKNFPPCKYFVNDKNEYYITCQDEFGSSFLFNQNQKRFQYTDVTGGFIYPHLNKKTPYMSIGFCSSF